MKFPLKSRAGGLAVLVAAAVAALIAGCSVAVEPSVGQYALVTGHGALSNQQLQAVYGPGARASVNGGSIIWYVPSNQRNYVTAPAGNVADRSNPQAVLTAKSKSGSDGIPVVTYSFVSWELNPAIQNEHNANKVSAVAQHFFRFCLKYGCATQQSQQNASNAGLSHSSVPGWNNMLAENFPTAIDNASQTAALKFGPDLWTNRAEWVAYGKDIAALLPGELQNLTGSGGYNYFCGPGSTGTDCKPFYVAIKNVVPQDPGAMAAYNQSVSASIQGQAAQARLATASKLYGPYAHWYLAESDLINQCKPNCPNWAFTQPGTAPGK